MKTPFLIHTVLFYLPVLLFSQQSNFSLKEDFSKIDRAIVNAPTSYSPALKKATPAVVAVTTQQIVRRLYPGYANPREEFLRRYFGWRGLDNPRIEEELVPAGIGSGVIVSPEGYTITNAHVITDPRTGQPVQDVTVQLADKREYKARIIGFDRSTDVAVLKINSQDPLPHVILANSDLLEVGDVVFAAGNPLGIGMTVTMGIISATQRTELGILDQDGGSYENFIQTDASINQGNSGGALLDAKGRLIGINTAIISQTGASIGIGLAIPVNMVRKVLTDLVQRGGIQRGFLGVELTAVSSGQGGAIVNKVVPRSAADLAGFKIGDRILKVGDRIVESINQSKLAISQTQPGTRVPIDIIREGKKITLFVTLDLMGRKNRISIPGVNLESLNSINRSEFGIPPNTKGVVVTESTGEAETFKLGVVIVEINGYQINTVKDVEEQLKKGNNRFYVWYKNKYRFLSYRVP